VQTALDAMREGAVDFVVKPVDAEQLLLVVDRALKSRQNGASASPAMSPRAPVPCPRDPRARRARSRRCDHREGAGSSARSHGRLLRRISLNAG
jgi:DNA-binding response OmpR family regulator